MFGLDVHFTLVPALLRVQSMQVSDQSSVKTCFMVYASSCMLIQLELNK
jgi:hypothetical protein